MTQSPTFRGQSDAGETGNLPDDLFSKPCCGCDTASFPDWQLSVEESCIKVEGGEREGDFLAPEVELVGGRSTSYKSEVSIWGKDS